MDLEKFRHSSCHIVKHASLRVNGRNPEKLEHENHHHHHHHYYASFAIYRTVEPRKNVKEMLIGIST